MSGVRVPSVVRGHASKRRALAHAVGHAGIRARVRQLAGNGAGELLACTPVAGAREDARHAEVRTDSPGDSRHAAAQPGDRDHRARRSSGDTRGRRGVRLRARDSRHRARAVRTQERLFLEAVLKLMR